MRNTERVQHELYAKTKVFQQKFDRAKQLIEDALDTIERPYIAFSGGVDSTVLLDLLYSAGHKLDVYWGDDGYDYFESIRFFDTIEERYDFYLHRIRCLDPWNDWCKEMSRPDLVAPPITPEIDAAWGNPHDWDDTWSSLKDAWRQGYSGVFLGMLARESQSRRLVLNGGKRPLYQVKEENDMWHCSPLAAWSKFDVWAYIVSRNLPYNPAYDKLAELGMPLEWRRVAPLTCFRVVQYGSHGYVLKSGWPELYNKLCAIFPRVQMYS